MKNFIPRHFELNNKPSAQRVGVGVEICGILKLIRH